MTKGINTALLVLDLAGATLFSLGTLTPGIVRSLGQGLSNYVFSKPTGIFRAAAHARVVKPEIKDPKDLIVPCLIEFVVGLLIWMVVQATTFLLLLGFSLWGLIYASTKPGRHPVAWGLSVIGLIVCISGACSMIPLKPKKIETTWDKLLRRVVWAAERLWKLTNPFTGLFVTFISVFTKTIPLWWYRSLKAIHLRGINWLFTLIGFLILVGGFAFRLSHALMAP